MAGERLLNMPHLEAKYAKYLNPHIHTEQLMDQWAKEQPKQEAESVETKKRASDGKRRKGRNRKEDRPSPKRGKAVKASGGNSHVDESAGEFDPERWLREQEEKEVK